MRFRSFLFVVSLVLLLGLIGQSQAQAPTFSTPFQVAADAFQADIALDNAGNILIVASDIKARGEIVFFKSTDGGATFSAPINISNNPGWSLQPVIATTQTGPAKIYVVWLDETPKNPDIFFSSSSDGGKTFTAPINISNNSGSSGRAQLAFGEQVLDDNFDLAIDDAGTIYVAWSDDTSGDWELLFSKSTDGGKTFSKPVNLPKGDTSPRLPDIAIYKGTIYVAWADLSKESGDISFSKSTDGGQTWSAPINISNNKGFSDAPDIAIDKDGNIYVVFDDATTKKSQILFSRSTDGGNTFSAPMAIANPARDNGFPNIVIDSKGNIFVAYYEYPPTGSNVKGSYNYSTDAGQTFVGFANIPGAEYVTEAPIELVADGVGNIYMTWTKVSQRRGFVFFLKATLP